MTNISALLLVGALLLDSACNIARIVVIVWAARKSERMNALARMEHDERVQAAASVVESVVRATVEEIQSE